MGLVNAIEGKNTMKNMIRTTRLVTSVLVVTTVVAANGVGVRAGELDPPAGPVVPTHKTLTEVEPRIAVNADNTPGDADSLFKITQPGSYYLTGNVTGQSGMHGIQLEADGVTLDLGGFTLLGVAGSLDGINMPAFRENVVIRNGHLRNWGESGIRIAHRRRPYRKDHGRRQRRLGHR